jgi:four helix bundle protein
VNQTFEAMGKSESSFDEWTRGVPAAIASDPVWTLQAYRLAMYLADVGWDDVSLLDKDHRTRSLADQLYRSLGSVSANIEEGYSRSSARDRARFYEYAFGSARETRGWYFKARHLLGDAHVHSRIECLASIIRLLLKTSNLRGYSVSDNEALYIADPEPPPLPG